MPRLTNTKIETYAGNVLPLRLLGEEGIEHADIKWSVIGDAVSIRTFENEDELPFTNGIIIQFEKVGEAKIAAILDGKEYVCEISVREMRKAGVGDKLSYYRGDLHTHTTRIHNHEEFVNRTEGFQSDMVGFIKEENLLDFGVLSDHADIMRAHGFFAGFSAVEDAAPMGPILFPGSESENAYSIPDRLGRNIRHAGEMVVINADYLSNSDNWDDFLAAFKNARLPIGIFAHPALDRWDYDFERNSIRKELMRIVRCVEVGNGNDVKNNLLHEYSYSRALDAGFRVTTSCGSDGHAIWGYKICPGKTVIMATGKSKEAFTDALLNLRAYACESANVKLAYTVNGKAAPCDLELTDTYKFHIDLSYFEEDESTRIVKCQVISDGGLDVYEKDGITEDSIDFEIKSDTARYFYLRLIDKEGRRTFSPPVFCGREYDKFEEPKIAPLDQSAFTAKDELTGMDGSSLLSFDGHAAWTNEATKANVVIDMKEPTYISALGMYYSDVPPRERLDPSSNCKHHAGYPRKYRISTSLDGVEYIACKAGMLRGSCIEDIACFTPHTARYVKFEVESTVGMQYEREKYKNSPVKIGGLTLYKPE